MTDIFARARKSHSDLFAPIPLHVGISEKNPEGYPNGNVDGWRDTKSPLFDEIFENSERLVDLADAVPLIIRMPAYSTDRQFVRETVADLLTRAQQLLPDGFHLVLFDGWRSLATQRELYDQEYAKHLDHRQAQKYVSLPSEDSLVPSPHNTGGAVDVGIMHKGKLLDFGTPFDHMDARSGLTYCEQNTSIGEVARDSRRMLYHVMTQAGFEPYQEEWWHFNYGNQMATKACYYRTGEQITPVYGSCEPVMTT